MHAIFRLDKKGFFILCLMSVFYVVKFVLVENPNLPFLLLEKFVILRGMQFFIQKYFFRNEKCPGNLWLSVNCIGLDLRYRTISYKAISI